MGGGPRHNCRRGFFARTAREQPHPQTDPPPPSKQGRGEVAAGVLALSGLHRAPCFHPAPASAVAAAGRGPWSTAQASAGGGVAARGAARGCRTSTTRSTTSMLRRRWTSRRWPESCWTSRPPRVPRPPPLLPSEPRAERLVAGGRGPSRAAAAGRAAPPAWSAPPQSHATTTAPIQLPSSLASYLPSHAQVPALDHVSREGREGGGGLGGGWEGREGGVGLCGT